MNHKRYLTFIIFGILAFLYLWFTFLDDDNKSNISEGDEEDLIAQAIPKPVFAWKAKIETQQDLKIGIITDTHIRATRFNKKDKSPSALRYIKEKYLKDFVNFNKQMSILGPDFIIHLGDIVEGTDDPDFVSLNGIALVKNELLKNNVPIYWLIGNHELRSITKEQFKEVLDLDSLQYYKDIGDYRFIFLDGNFNPDNIDTDFMGQSYLPGFIHPKTLNWLEELLKTEKRVFVFMHQAVLGADFFQSDEFFKSAVANWRQVMDLFEKYDVEAFFNGHIENRYYKEVNGVKYYSLTGTKKSVQYPASYYELVIENGQPRVTMYYTEPEINQSKTIDFETGKEIKKQSEFK